MFFSYIISTAYNSNLIGFLTFLEKEEIPTTFKQLHDSPHYSITLYSFGGLEVELLKTSPNPVFQGIVKRMAWIKDLITCLHRAAKPGNACIAWNLAVEYARAKNSVADPSPNNLFMSDDSGGLAVGSIGFKKGSIYKETFSRFVGMAMNGFLVEYWREKFIRRVKENALRAAREKRGNKYIYDSHGVDDDGSPKTLNVASVMIVFLLIIGGFVISICVFLIEKSNLLQICTIIFISCSVRKISRPSVFFV